MQMKQPAWQSMPVLDVRTLSSKQINALAACYDELSGEGLESLSHLKGDTVRCKIDGSISHVLGIPDLLSVRELLEREPGFSATDISPRNAPPDEDEDEELM